VESDVLFNIRHDNPQERYVDFEICTLKIKSLNEEMFYRKHFSETKQDIVYNATMELLHDPHECMYPHSIFRVYFNDEIVTYDNYKVTIAKHQKIKTSIKEELASMIRRREVQQDGFPVS
jgi:hypothetical protein